MGMLSEPLTTPDPPQTIDTPTLNWGLDNRNNLMHTSTTCLCQRGIKGE